jgi:hypothetical protein
MNNFLLNKNFVDKMSLNFLPKEIENIILNYKENLDKNAPEEYIENIYDTYKNAEYKNSQFIIDNGMKINNKNIFFVRLNAKNEIFNKRGEIWSKIIQNGKIKWIQN